MAGAVAAATSRGKVGTWILSALHRNPAIKAKAVERFTYLLGHPRTPRRSVDQRPVDVTRSPARSVGRASVVRATANP